METKKTIGDRIGDIIQGLILVGASYAGCWIIWKKMMSKILDD